MQLSTDPVILREQLAHLVETSERIRKELTSPVVVFNTQEEFWHADTSMYRPNGSCQQYQPPSSRFAKFTDYRNANVERNTVKD